MPVSLDAQTPASSPTPPAGPGSQTPPNPNTETTPLGGVSAPKPMGAPGAPPIGGAGGTPPPAGGAKPGAPGQPQPGGQPPAPAIPPDDLNRYKAIQQSLYPDLTKAIKSIAPDESFKLEDATDEQVMDIKDYLLDLGWDSTYLSNEILKTNNVQDIKKFFELVQSYQDKAHKDDLKQLENFINNKIV